ncbi:hypothetical protein MyNCGM683_49550, partial [Achromobacter xylosoxidans]
RPASPPNPGAPSPPMTT